MTKIDDARAALAQAKSQPAAALAAAKALIDEAVGPASPPSTTDVEVVARWAIGIALYELGRNTEAVLELERAFRQAPDTQAPRIEVSLASALVASGKTTDAKQRLERLRSHEDPVVAALAVSQLGITALHGGDLSKAHELLLTAIPALRSAGERNALARVVGNVGHGLLLLDRIEESMAYTSSALEIAESCDEQTIVAGSLQNLGYGEMRLGNLPAAIRQLERARDVYATIGETGRNLATLYDDLAETYRFGGLVVESLRYAQLGLRISQSGSNEEKRADATFRLAKCLLAAGRADDALTEATKARDQFLQGERFIQAHRASLFILETQVSTGSQRTLPAATQIDEASQELAAAGWHVEALAFRTRCVDHAKRSDPELAATLLHASAPLESQAPAAQLENHYLAALSATPERSQQALDRAHDLLSDRLGRVRDAELRSGAARAVERFRELELERPLMAEDGEHAVLVHERWRSVARTNAAPGPMNAEIAAATEELRMLIAGHDLATSDLATGEMLLSQIQRHEEKITRLSMGQDAVASAPSNALQLDELRHELGHSVLIVFIPAGQHIFSVEISSSSAPVLRRACDVREIMQLANRMRKSHDQLLRAGLPTRTTEAVQAAMVADCQNARNLLFSQLADSSARDLSLVIAPPPGLFDLAWSLIVEPFASSTLVVDSLTSFRSERCELADGDVAVLCGPDLDHAESDIAAVAQTFPNCRIDRQATARDFRQSIANSSLVHLCAHGTFRADAPRFSSLHLADGPLLVYELDQLDSVPRIVVLGSCEAGRATGIAGGDGLGAAAALRAVGSECVVAPIHAVPDAETARLFEHFYAALPNNTPSRALASSRTAVSDESTRMWATAHAMQCVGNSFQIVCSAS